MSSIFKILAPKVSPAIPISNVAAPVSLSTSQFIGTWEPTITKASLPNDLPIVPAFKVSSMLLKATVSPPVLPGYSFKISVGLAIIFVSLERISDFNWFIKTLSGYWFEGFTVGALGKLVAPGGFISFI